MKRLSEILAMVLLGCVFIRVVAWLVTPALPMLVVLTLLAAAVYRIIAGPRFKGFDKFFK
jgi:hypothetical protein